MKRVSIIILGFLLIAAVILAGYFLHQRPPAPAVAREGIIDLREVNLEKSVPLNGDWRFYWHQLLTSSSVADTSTTFLKVPGLWNYQTWKGTTLPGQGYATYSLTVLLPPGDNKKLALKVPDMYTSLALYINDSLFTMTGRPATSRESYIPDWQERTLRLTVPGDTLHLLLQLANFDHSKGGIYQPILIGNADYLFLAKQRGDGYDLMLCGCLFMGGLFFLGLFLFSRDKPTLFFSLFCILYSYRMIGTDEYVLHAIFPHLPWMLTARLEYLTLALPVALFGLYTRYLYPQETNKNVMNVLAGICLLFSVVILFMPPAIFTSLLNPFLIIMFLYIGYAFYVYIRAAKNQRPGSIYALISSSVILLVFLIINLHYLEMLPIEKGIVFTGYILFFFLQSLALSHRFAYTLKLATIQARQGLKAKSEFLSTMSHEIRTPLNAVIGMAHLLIRRQPRPDQKENLDVLLFSANNLLSIVNDILDYNKIEEGKIVLESIEMDLPAIGRNIAAGLTGLATDKGIELRLQIDETIPHHLTGDPTRTSQVISNLVHNAIKFTKTGWVRLSMDLVELKNQQATVTIRIKDTGIGISSEKQKLIFERFTQADSSTSRSYGGTGLGLAISKKILALQNVTLQLQSTEHQGAEFYFTQTFPVTEKVIRAETLSGPEEPATPDEQALNTLECLLVEDNPFNVMVAQTILENAGAKVEVATNGQEALDKFDPTRHQVILMDLHMPVMDGYEATRQLRKQGARLPIIALTASTPQEVEHETSHAGLNDVLVKPFNPDDLFRVIKKNVRPGAVQ